MPGIINRSKQESIDFRAWIYYIEDRKWWLKIGYWLVWRPVYGGQKAYRVIELRKAELTGVSNRDESSAVESIR